ncbi:MAG: hypothetical protein QW209_06335 [Nitrososphaerota archaeon]
MSQLLDVINYIREREQTLENYSKKLRKSINFIADLFNTPKNFCVICQSLHREDQKHKELQAINVTLDVDDDEPFYVDDFDNKYFLCFYERYLRAKIVTPDGSCIYDFIEKLPRKALKALIKTRRLIKFLQKVAEELEKANEEYSKVAEIAEKMATAVGMIY